MTLIAWIPAREGMTYFRWLNGYLLLCFRRLLPPGEIFPDLAEISGSALDPKRPDRYLTGLFHRVDGLLKPKGPVVRRICAGSAPRVGRTDNLGANRERLGASRQRRIDAGKSST